MEYFLILFKQVGIMSLLMAVGVYLIRARIIDVASTKAIGSMLLYVVIPAIIVNSLWIERTRENITALALSALLAAVTLVIAVVCSRLIFRMDTIASFGTTFSNAGFIGIPLVQACCGESAVLYITSLIVLINLLQWTYGMSLLGGTSQRITPSSLLHNPVVIAFSVGMVLLFAAAPHVYIIDKTLENICAVNTPLAMILLGTYLAQGSATDIVRDVPAYRVCAIRLLLIPAVTAGMLLVLPGGTLMKQALLIASATPVGANVALFCQQLGKDYRYASNTVCLSTILSVVTLPLVGMLASMLYA